MNPSELDRRFSPRRLLLLVRNRVLDDAPAFAVASAAIFALRLLLLLLRSGPRSPALVLGAWPVLIAAGGVLLAARAFERMHDGRAATEWLLLPASSAEKYLSACAVYLLLYPLAAGAAAVVLSAGLSLAALVLGSGGFAVWDPLAGLSLKAIGSYLTFAAFAMAGSARFRKLPLLKTAAAAVGASVVFGFAAMALLAVFSEEGRAAFAVRGQHRFSTLDLPSWKTQFLEALGAAAKIASFAFATLYGYFRVAEKEASDEVQ